MNREQMEAWCTLEGLELRQFRLSTGDNRFRIMHTDEKGEHMLSYEGQEWHVALVGISCEYSPVSWDELPQTAYDEIPIKLLTELTKK